MPWQNILLIILLSLTSGTPIFHRGAQPNSLSSSCYIFIHLNPRDVQIIKFKPQALNRTILWIRCRSSLTLPSTPASLNHKESTWHEDIQFAKKISQIPSFFLMQIVNKPLTDFTFHSAILSEKIDPAFGNLSAMQWFWKMSLLNKSVLPCSFKICQEKG